MSAPARLIRQSVSRKTFIPSCCAIISSPTSLLISGTPLPITEYSEGELSILANQVQKLTLRLTEAAEVVEADKKYLADSLADISHQLRTPLCLL